MTAMTMLPRIFCFVLPLSLGVLLAGCGGADGGDGPRVRDDPQSISLAAAPPLQVAATAQLKASASSGLPVSYSSLSPAVCAVDEASGLLQGLSIGDCSIVVSQGGNDRFAPAPRATLTLAVQGRSQGLVFDAAPVLVVDDSVQVRAGATSGLAVRYSSLSAAVCEVDAASGRVSALAGGTCLLLAEQTGDRLWAAAEPARLSLAVQLRSQAVVLDALPALLVGGGTQALARAGSGLPVRYSSLTPEVCAIDAGSGSVTARAAGTCTIAAAQAGDSRWAAAASEPRSTAVTRATQALVFGEAPTWLMVGATLTLRASAGSGLPVAYASKTAASCSIDAQTGVVSALTSGSCTITASQPGNAAWAPAVPVTATFAVLGMGQAINFGTAPALTAGSTASVRAVASSGLAVRYSSLTPATCSVDAAGLVRSLAIGACTVAADQDGDARFAPAVQATQGLVAAGASQRINFGSTPALTVGGSATLGATASSGLAVVFSSLTPTVCSVQSASGQVTALSTGSCTIAANQPGNTVWAPASQGSLVLNVAGRPQSIAFGAAPALSVGGSATARATATSGLRVDYSSLTPGVCAIEAASGVLTGLSRGACVVAANQAGNSSWAAAPQQTLALNVTPNPAQSITFAAAPTLGLGGSATVRATASSGLPVAYGSFSPSVCSVQADSGLVVALGLGDCVITADQPGDAIYNPAPQATLTLAVQLPAGVRVPGVPQGVSASLGLQVGSVVLSVTGVDSGGSPIRGYTVTSAPAGIVVNATALPVVISCPGSCAGYAFSVSARNDLGSGNPSAPVQVLTTFDVLTTFYEPDTQPRNSIFTGSFTLNSTTGTISGLAGNLTESMTGNAVGSPPYFDMTRVPLVNQLKSWRDTVLGGTFVASFARSTTTTFASIAGGDGWSPEAGIANGGIYAGFPGAHAISIRNAYVLIFVPDNPYAALSPAQISKLAYADCAPGGMMGAVCMTATSVAGYGAVGTMSGYPVSQVLRRR